MAKYDVYSSISASSEYLLDLQDEIIDNLSTRVVAPLVPVDEVPRRMKILNPIISVAGVEFLLMTHLLAAIPASTLKIKVGSVLTQRDEIIASLDFLFTGF
ncbi:MAG: plasmid maintenance protein CcdB [Deltaproteobacteria bacterium]|nr:MAG: plasmid maintenance protein CcdB [Deltaproteobacteria bacterium]